MFVAEFLSDVDLQPNVDAQPGPILAAVTFDEQGRSCLRHALRRAAHTGRSAIALHVVHETERNMGLYRCHDQGEELMPYADVARRLLADLSAEVVAGLPNADEIGLRQLVVEGLPKGRIAEVAELTGAELVVVGGGGERPALDRWFGRHVAETVRRRASCPVLIVDSDGNVVVDPGLPHVDRKQALPSGLETH